MAAEVTSGVGSNSKDIKGMELTSFSVCKAENGYKVNASYEKKNKTLSQRAGWVPSVMYANKDYVYTDEKQLVSEISKLVKELKK